MNRQTYRTLELIKEINQFCATLNIDSFVGGIIPYGILSHKAVNAPMAEVYVQEEHISELAGCIRSKAEKSRILEEDAAEEKCFRYIDDTTLFIDFADVSKYENNGIYVRIKPFSSEDQIITFNNYFEDSAHIDANLGLKSEAYYGYQISVPDSLDTYAEALYGQGINSVGSAFSGERYYSSTEISYTDVLKDLDLKVISDELKQKDAIIAEYKAEIDDCNIIIRKVQSQIREMYEQADE